MTGEGVDLLSRLDVPELEGLIAAAGEHAAAGGQERHRPDLTGMSAEGTDQRDFPEAFARRVGVFALRPISSKVFECSYGPSPAGGRPCVHLALLALGRFSRRRRLSFEFHQFRVRLARMRAVWKLREKAVQRVLIDRLRQPRPDQPLEFDPCPALAHASRKTSQVVAKILDLFAGLNEVPVG